MPENVFFFVELIYEYSVNCIKKSIKLKQLLSNSMVNLNSIIMVIIKYLKNVYDFIGRGYYYPYIDNKSVILYMYKYKE